MATDPALAFAVQSHEPPALEVRVNFGVYAGRDATPAEIDNLAAALLEQVGAVSIVSEDRHEIDDQSEASIHQVRIEIGQDSLPQGTDAQKELGVRVVVAAEQWAKACIAERPSGISEL
ncbi:MAG TPA: hypothetical protein VH968_08195 [Gaiellaceae bacterium]|jgi:hypothetical protein